MPLPLATERTIAAPGLRLHCHRVICCQRSAVRKDESVAATERRLGACIEGESTRPLPLSSLDRSAHPLAVQVSDADVGHIRLLTGYAALVNEQVCVGAGCVCTVTAQVPPDAIGGRKRKVCHVTDTVCAPAFSERARVRCPPARPRCHRCEVLVAANGDIGDVGWRGCTRAIWSLCRFGGTARLRFCTVTGVAWQSYGPIAQKLAVIERKHWMLAAPPQ